ncbi:hypothetical protein B4U80_11258 [Leptotrombidium deliense]|uniref:Uncharacterized protein n=1 Tax=Leptotrombidium deliense TaxID=299467 RepID=A0A443SNT9_9ACAR|nr:hypothetical protein B4U80_11258 [Leptotrombidium deliense]
MSTTVTTVTSGHQSQESVKKRNPEPLKGIRKVTPGAKEDGSKGTSSLRHSYKLNERSVALLVNVDEGKSTVAPQSGKVGWKSSKLFSRTLSSIEVIRAMKQKQATAATVTVTSNPTASSSNITHTTVELTPPKITLLTVPEEERNTKAANDWKFLKNKLTSLRKKGSGSAEKTISEAKPPDLESRTPSLTKNSLSASNSKQSLSAKRTERSGSQDEGIVCKKEDLLFLLTEASKSKTKNSEATQQSSSRKNSYTSTGKRVTINTENIDSSVKEACVDNSNSNETDDDQCTETVKESVVKPSASKLRFAVEKLRKEQRSAKQKERKSNLVKKVTVIENENVNVHPDDEEGESSAAAVKWDDSNVVDAMMFGDAIQAFLKGMGGSNPPSTSTSEKKVSFKNNC